MIIKSKGYFEEKYVVLKWKTTHRKQGWSLLAESRQNAQNSTYFGVVIGGWMLAFEAMDTAQQISTSSGPN